MNKKQRATDFSEYLSKQLKNPVIKKHYDKYGKQLEIAYKILQARKQAGISQAQLAKKIDTKQSNIARMEAGEQNFTTETLEKIAAALNRKLEIDFARR
jgi:ribosome-binding protein aMBF1 (putative translation factor)